LRIADEVAGESAPAGARTWVGDQDWLVGRTLVDAGDAAVVVARGSSLPQIH
jgi:hypothetical protein